MTTPYAETVRAVRETLEDTFDRVDAWFDRPAAVLAYRPRGGGWTVEQVLEHITLTNHFLLLVIRKGSAKALRRAVRGAQVPAGESDLALLAPIGRRGSFRRDRPEHMEPAGSKPLAEVREPHAAAAPGVRRGAVGPGPGRGALHRVRMSVNNAGRLDLYQWLYFLAQHARRHLAQMEANESEWGRQPAGDTM